MLLTRDSYFTHLRFVGQLQILLSSTLISRRPRGTTACSPTRRPLLGASVSGWVGAQAPQVHHRPAPNPCEAACPPTGSGESSS